MILSFIVFYCDTSSMHSVILHISPLKVADMLPFNFGPSRVGALLLAAGINVGGHYEWHFFSFFLSSGSLLILPEGVVIGIQIFAWAPKGRFQ